MVQLINAFKISDLEIGKAYKIDTSQLIYWYLFEDLSTTEFKDEIIIYLGYDEKMVEQVKDRHLESLKYYSLFFGDIKFLYKNKIKVITMPIELIKDLSFIEIKQ